MRMYKDYFKFAKRIGILDEEGLKELGWKCDNGNRICVSRLKELKEFVEKLNCRSIDFIKGGTGKRYHIATEVDAGELEDMYREEHGLDEDIAVVASCFVNDVAYVNRLDYFLCDGNSDADIFLEEVEEG